MADIPFLGCKISLISKCDIRYEGILYCVDPKESTIALSKVKSYGTENRADPSNYVPPKNDVFDIIIFRATDVKDLRVDAPEPPGLSDPAIISARQSSVAFDGINNGSLPTSSGPSQQQQQQQLPQQQKPLLPFLPTGSTAVKKPDAPSSRDGPRRDTDRREDRRPERRDDNRREIKRDDRREDKRDDRREDRRDDRREDKRDERREDKRDERREDRRDDRRNDRRNGPPQDRRENDNRRGESGRPTRVSRGGYERNHVNPHPRYNQVAGGGYNSARRGPNNKDENSKSSGPRRGSMHGGRRGRPDGERIGAPRGMRKGVPLKFEGDFDFDENNKLFLELEGKLKSMNLKDGDKEGESSADRANSKSPDGRSESGSGYDSDDQNKDGDSKNGLCTSVTEEYYDKSKSFFDNISCEASERIQGKMNKPDWRKERQTNTETFGVSANYRGGGYRGRAFRANGYHRR